MGSPLQIFFDICHGLFWWIKFTIWLRNPNNFWYKFHSSDDEFSLLTLIIFCFFVIPLFVDRVINHISYTNYVPNVYVWYDYHFFLRFLNVEFLIIELLFTVIIQSSAATKSWVLSNFLANPVLYSFYD